MLQIEEDRASQASLTMNLSVREVIRRLVDHVEMNMILEENTIWEFPKRCSPIDIPRRPVNELILSRVHKHKDLYEKYSWRGFRGRHI